MTGRKPVIVSRTDGHLQCDVVAVSDWEGFEKLFRFLERHYDAKVQRQFDGPDSRRWVLDVQGKALEIQHEDPWGNVILAPHNSNSSPMAWERVHWNTIKNLLIGLDIPVDDFDQTMFE